MLKALFYLYYQVIPDYDMKSQPNPIPVRYHGDIDVTSDILKLHVSFKWQPIINGKIFRTIRQWATDSQSERPHLIFLGNIKYIYSFIQLS
jgi:hypothetical protein